MRDTLIYIGIDNGVTGSIAMLEENGQVFNYFETPVVKALNYTKKVSWFNRVDFFRLFREMPRGDAKCLIERPMVNPTRFKATISAIRALEVTETVLGQAAIPYEFIDSKEWQRAMLPSGVSKEMLKVASDQVARRLFPKVQIKKQGLGDSLLIAEYARRKDKT